MPTICPKCCHVRKATETAPEWQCPACGVAYAKVGGAARHGSSSATNQRTANSNSSNGIPWLKLIALAEVLWGVWSAYKVSSQRTSFGTSLGSFATKFDTDLSAEQLRALAFTTQADDVLIFSAPWCGNCNEAMG